MQTNASYWIHHLQLLPHPEGGYYKEVFRSKQQVNRVEASAVKQACTSIYYLLQAPDFSTFHRLLSDECWYFHKGAPLLIHVIDEEGKYLIHRLSDDVSGALSIVVPAGLWFAAEVEAGCDFTLVSCAVAPGFDFNEFEIAERNALVTQYPQHSLLLNKFCKI